MRTVRGRKVAIRTKDMIGPYFSTHIGVRQGDPFSPLLFNIAIDGLVCLIKNAQGASLLVGLAPHIIDEGCACLQYAYDIVFMIQDSLKAVRNIKFILILFEQMSDLMINFHKSEIYLFGDVKGKGHLYTDIFSCRTKSLPMKYLGVPIDNKKLSLSQWQQVEEKIEKKLGV
jgi:hypothetical protein